MVHALCLMLFPVTHMTHAPLPPPPTSPPAGVPFTGVSYTLQVRRSGNRVHVGLGWMGACVDVRMPTHGPLACSSLASLQYFNKAHTDPRYAAIVGCASRVPALTQLCASPVTPVMTLGC